METVDILIAVVAVVALGGSLAGAALYEPPAGGPQFRVTFAESTEESLTAKTNSDQVQAATSPGDPGMVVSHNITETGLTELRFEVVITTSSQVPQRAATPTYEAYLVAPDGTELREGDATDSGSFGTSASFTLTVPDSYLVADVPEDQRMRGQGPQDIQDELNETVLRSNATGVWEVHVHMTFPAGSAPVSENLVTTSTPKIKRITATVGPDVDVSPAA